MNLIQNDSDYNIYNSVIVKEEHLSAVETHMHMSQHTETPTCTNPSSFHTHTHTCKQTSEPMLDKII